MTFGQMQYVHLQVCGKWTHPKRRQVLHLLKSCLGLGHPSLSLFLPFFTSTPGPLFTLPHPRTLFGPESLLPMSCFKLSFHRKWISLLVAWPGVDNKQEGSSAHTRTSQHGTCSCSCQFCLFDLFCFFLLLLKLVFRRTIAPSLMLLLLKLFLFFPSAQTGLSL